MIAKEGQTFVTSTGFIRPRPEIAIAKTARKEMLQIGDRFALNPEARRAMGISLPSPPSPASRFFDT